jgi:hypothetical protein
VSAKTGPPHVPSDEVSGIVTRELLVEWLQHPVTRAIGLVIAAEIAYHLVLRHGARLLGLEEAGE